MTHPRLAETADAQLSDLWPAILERVASIRGQGIGDVAAEIGCRLGTILSWVALDQPRLASLAMAYGVRADAFEHEANRILFGGKPPSRDNRAMARAMLRHARDMRRLSKSLIVKSRPGRVERVHRGSQVDAVLKVYREQGIRRSDTDLAARAVREHHDRQNATARQDRLRVALTKIERAYVVGAAAGRDEYDRQKDADPTIALDLAARFPEIDQRRTFRKLHGLPSRGPLARKAVPVSEDALIREAFGLPD